jgi:PIN domain nuclease of toxin-antitoxin system
MAAIDALLAATSAFRVVALDHEQARELSTLSAIGDPFGRMIVAAARVARRPLITVDDDITSSGLVQTIWD